MKITLSQSNSESGVIFYEGPSLINGEPIVAIATLRSRNVKTGPMIQTWILNQNINPVEAIATGQDDSICGSCRHRGSGKGKNRSCYVNVGQAPNNIYRKFKNDGYTDCEDDYSWARRRFVRCGAYGDPAAVPTRVWAKICAESSGWTGYTHQWRDCDQYLRNFCMASADSESERDAARNAGWRTFRVRDESDPLGPGEFVCPASPEGGNRMDCLNCLACSGLRDGKLSARSGSVSIVVHGSKPKLAGWKNMVKEN